MLLFKVIGLKPPYRVDIYQIGTVNLDTITDELAEELWRDGNPFLALTEEGRAKFYPEQKPITVEKLNTKKGTSSTQ